MKTIKGFILIFIVGFLFSCEGPMGPPGRDGQDGMDAEIGTVVEVYGDFTPQNDYTLYYEFDDYDIKVYDGDAVLVYILWQYTDGVDIWRLLPQTVVLEEGVVQYNYDFTTANVQIYLTGTVDGFFPAETDDQVFRIAVLPAALLAENKSIDVTDFSMVMKSLNRNLNSIEKINITAPER